jgi:hypothetical protein
MLRLLALLFCAQIGVLTAEDFIRPRGSTLRIPRVTRPPKLSDFLNNTPREAEVVVSEFWQNQPGDGAPVSQPTTAYLSYDDKNLYVAFMCKDDPKLIRARVARREQIGSDDRFNVCIDTFHDHRHMYWFDINPYGVQSEGNFTEGVEDDPSWDTLWRSEARLVADGYMGLVAIPFKSIRFPADRDQTWGLILGRWIVRNNEFSLWPYVSRQKPGFALQGGDLEGFQEISPGRNVQLIPYGLLARSRFLDMPATGAPAFRSDSEGRAGLDAKMVLKDSFALDVALNPDFSQIESDEPQVTVNQRFEVVYPEKRPFFMENAGYFKTPEQLFFSRRIIDPKFGARLTGKIGKWNLGILAADDRAPGEQSYTPDRLRGKQAGIGVVRLQRELGRNKNVAVMATSTDFGSTHNRVYSIDTRLQVLRNWIFSGQAMSSDTRLASGGRLAGPAYYLKWNHAGKHFVSETVYTDRSPGFRADLGYFSRVDIRQAQHTIGYRWRPEGKKLISFGPYLKGMINYDRQGRLQDWSVNPEFQIELTRMTYISLERWEGFELFAGRGFRKGHNEYSFQSDWKKWLSLRGGFTHGTSINYYPGAGLSPFTARTAEAEAGFTLRPTKRARIDESYIYSSLRTDAGSVFNNHIIRSKVNYQFSREASLRLIADYNSVLPNATLVNLERSKHIGIDALFTYLLNPGTAFHAGYTDLYDNWKLDPTLSPALRRTTFPDLNTGRQVFVKLSYLFRF